MCNIRIAKNDDINEIKEVWKLCFEDTDEYRQLYFDKIYKPENTIVGIEDKRIVASLQMIPRSLVIDGETKEIIYIVGVDTHPDYRYKGWAAKLMHKSFEVMKERGYNLSMLLPFKHEFYRKYGYETFCYKNKYEISGESIKSKRAIVVNENYKVLEFDNINRIFVTRFELYLKRDASFENHLKDSVFEKLKIYSIKNEAYAIVDDRKDQVKIFEISYMKEQAGIELYNHLSFIYNTKTLLHTTSSSYIPPVIHKVIEENKPYIMYKDLSNKLNVENLISKSSYIKDYY